MHYGSSVCGQKRLMRISRKVPHRGLRKVNRFEIFWQLDSYEEMLREAATVVYHQYRDRFTQTLFRELDPEYGTTTAAEHVREVVMLHRIEAVTGTFEVSVFYPGHVRTLVAFGH